MPANQLQLNSMVISSLFEIKDLFTGLPKPISQTISIVSISRKEIIFI
jgi:hypothetical protein